MGAQNIKNRTLVPILELYEKLLNVKKVTFYRKIGSIIISQVVLGFCC